MKQQGDVLIHPIKNLPTGAIKRERQGDLVLAEGEATGHAHRIKDAHADIFDCDGVVYLTVDGKATLTHEEHGPITIDPGVYEIGIIVEVDPFEDEIRYVQD